MLRSAVCRRQRGQSGMSHSRPRDQPRLDSPTLSPRLRLPREGPEERPRHVDAEARLQCRSSAGRNPPIPRLATPVDHPGGAIFGR